MLQWKAGLPSHGNLLRLPVLPAALGENWGRGPGKSAVICSLCWLPLPAALPETLQTYAARTCSFPRTPSKAPPVKAYTGSSRRVRPANEMGCSKWGVDLRSQECSRTPRHSHAQRYTSFPRSTIFARNISFVNLSQPRRRRRALLLAASDGGHFCRSSFDCQRSDHAGLQNLLQNGPANVLTFRQCK